jgi:hypothetical protein
VDQAAVHGVLQRYVPPLSPDLVKKIASDICKEAEKEVSQSPVNVTASSKERTLRKRK